MSRFDCDMDDDGIPYELWQANVSRALGGRRGQDALAAIEEALLALPEPRLIESHLAADGGVCAIGALVAHKQAQSEGVDIRQVIDAMSVRVACWCGHAKEAHRAEGGCTGRRWLDKPCNCDEFEPEVDDPWETVEAGQQAGLKMTLSWHMAQLNDERFGGISPEDRYREMLAWVRRAQGKAEVES